MTDPDTEISWEEAAEWVAREYGLSVGAAEAERAAAVASDKVRISACMPRVIPGRTRVAAADLGTFPTGFLLREVRLNFDDLKYQIRQQIGRPPSGPKPQQQELDQALLQFAENADCKLKQDDAAARAMLKGLGATTRQIPIAFRNLPEKYRFIQGSPGKSGA